MITLPMGYSLITLTERLDEIDNALSHNLYQAALGLALTVPDICGQMEFPEEKTVCGRYVKWFSTYVEQHFETTGVIEDDSGVNPDYSKRAFNGYMCYNLRCAFLHSGDDSIQNAWKKSLDSQTLSDYSVSYDLILTKDATWVTCLTDDNRKTKNYSYYIEIPKLCRYICEEARKCIDVYGEDAFSDHQFKIYSSRQWERDRYKEVKE